MINENDDSVGIVKMLVLTALGCWPLQPHLSHTWLLLRLQCLCAFKDLNRCDNFPD